MSKMQINKPRRIKKNAGCICKNPANCVCSNPLKKFEEGDFVKITVTDKQSKRYPYSKGTYYGIIDHVWASTPQYYSVFIADRDGMSSMVTFPVSSMKKVPLREKEYNQIVKHWGSFAPFLKVRKNPEPTISNVPNFNEHQHQQDKATLTAAFIGHRLGRFLPVTNTTLSAGCERCGSTVTISGKTMSGLAVSTSCTK